MGLGPLWAMTPTKRVTSVIVLRPLCPFRPFKRKVLCRWCHSEPSVEGEDIRHILVVELVPRMDLHEPLRGDASDRMAANDSVSGERSGRIALSPLRRTVDPVPLGAQGHDMQVNVVPAASPKMEFRGEVSFLGWFPLYYSREPVWPFLATPCSGRTRPSP